MHFMPCKRQSYSFFIIFLPFLTQNLLPLTFFNKITASIQCSQRNLNKIYSSSCPPHVLLMSSLCAPQIFLMSSSCVSHVPLIYSPYAPHKHQRSRSAYCSVPIRYLLDICSIIDRISTEQIANDYRTRIRGDTEGIRRGMGDAYEGLMRRT